MKVATLIEILKEVQEKAPRANVLIDVGMDIGDQLGISYDTVIKRYVTGAFGVDDVHFIACNAVLLEL